MFKSQTLEISDNPGGVYYLSPLPQSKNAALKWQQQQTVKWMQVMALWTKHPNMRNGGYTKFCYEAL